jgi:hypothetical protein
LTQVEWWSSFLIFSHFCFLVPSLGSATRGW